MLKSKSGDLGFFPAGPGTHGVLIDVNVALDVILQRQPWLDDSKGVWDACYQMRMTGQLVTTGLTNLFSISRLLPYCLEISFFPPLMRRGH
jgi:hypothetical protein